MENSPTTILQQNPALLGLAEQLPSAILNVNRDRVIERLESTRDIYSHDYRNSIPVLIGRMGEIRVSLALEDKCSGFHKIVDLNPIKEPIVTSNYYYDACPGRPVRIHPKEKIGSYLMELDNLLVVHKLPTLFEIKLTKIYHTGGPKRAMARKRISFVKEKVTEFFREAYFKDDPYENSMGYAVITYPHHFNPEIKSQRQFREDGGIFIQFPFTIEEVYDEAGQIFKRLEI
jgi:hypothetical protein